jgi:hypothetical protein
LEKFPWVLQRLPWVLRKLPWVLEKLPEELRLVPLFYYRNVVVRRRDAARPTLVPGYLEMAEWGEEE